MNENWNKWNGIKIKMGKNRSENISQRFASFFFALVLCHQQPRYKTDSTHLVVLVE